MAFRPSLLLVVISFLLGALCRGAEQPELLFLQSQLVPEAADGLPAGPPSIRSKFALVNPSAAAQFQNSAVVLPMRAVLNLFSNEQYTAILERRELLAPLRAVFRGQIEGMLDSRVVLAWFNGAVAGSVFVPGRGNFQIQHGGNGWHRIAELDGSRPLPCSAGVKLHRHAAA